MSDKAAVGMPDGPPDLVSAASAANRVLTAGLIRELAKRGFDDLSPAYAAILPFIDLDGTRQVALAQRAGMTKQAVGQLVGDLEMRGYVELVPDPTDRRARIVRFTPRGLALRRAGLDAKRALWASVADAVGSDGAPRLARDLLTVVAALTAPATTPHAARKAPYGATGRSTDEV